MLRKSLYYFALNFILFFCFTESKINAMQHDFCNITDTLTKKYKKPIPIYLIETDSAKNTIIGIAAVPLSKSQPESTMGNFITDAMLAKAQQVYPKTVIAILNYNSIKKDYLSPGNITQGHILEMIPFNNKMILIEISGAVLQEFCNHIAKNKGWPISGISFVIKNNEATNIRVNSKPINDHILYLTAVPDYIAYGGNNCDFLESLKKIWTDIFIRDLLIEHIENLSKSGKELNSAIEQRIIYDH